ncbi:3'-5' exonuclease [Kineococcus radiotolerans]|uniref:3'-5' exonuclease n=1 Tax=Kineococcus radiotolerans TaxID=131568 RepID=UPI00003A434E|nr:3'-5' exonuclease [Kineococcus radiotolerans]
MGGLAPATHRRQAVRQAQRWLADESSVLLDTESTALDGQLVEIAITDVHGAPLFSSLVRPTTPVDPGARAVHGIGDEELQDAPDLLMVAPQLRAALAGRHVIAYNARFDRGLLRREGERIGVDLLSSTRWGCGMHCYTRFRGRVDSRGRHLRASRLPGARHRAVGDCRSLAEVLQEIAAG